MNDRQLAESFERFANNIQRYLFVITRDSQLTVREAMVDKGYRGLSMSYGLPIMTLSYGPARVTELASKLSISKQLCVQMLRPIEKAGLIRREPDPTDRRAKLVRLTRKGDQLVADATEQLKVMVDRYTDRIGKRKVQQLCRIFAALSNGTLINAFPLHNSGDLQQEVDSSIFLPALFNSVSKGLDKHIVELIKAQGHPGLSPSFLQVILFLSPQGANIDTIAETNGMTYQAVNRIANELESLGYVAKSNSPNSGVRRELLLTESGLALIQDLVNSVQIVESEIMEIIGQDDLDSLSAICKQLFLKAGREGDFISMSGSSRFDKSADNVFNPRRVDLGVAELMLYLSAGFDDSGHRRSHHIRLSRPVSETNDHLVSWSDSGRRMTWDTIIDVKLVAEEIRRRYGKARLDALQKLIDTLARELD